MKSIFRWAAMFSVAALTFAACSQNDDEPAAKKHVVLDLNITKDAESRAIKTGWENGDCISVLFTPGNSTTEYGVIVSLSYDGTKWNISEADQEKLDAISTSGKVTAVYAAGKELTWEYNKVYERWDSKEYLKGAEYMFTNQSKPFTLTDGKISATIPMGHYGLLQITIEGLNATDGWMLKNPNDEAYYQFEGAEKSTMEATGAGFTISNSNDMPCVANTDGIAFHVTTASYDLPIKIILKNKNGDTWTKEFGKRILGVKAYKLAEPSADNGWTFTGAVKE